MKTTAAIILAAGGSSRLGEPKQLLLYDQKNLVNNIIDAALPACDPVVLVVGANKEGILASLDDRKILVTENEHWQHGIASSIHAGLEKLGETAPGTKQFVIAVCDQPFVTTCLLQQLMEAAENSGKRIVACQYADTLGTPVLFDKKYVKYLKALNGDEGAKNLLKRFQDDIEVVSFPLGNFDVDSQEDYKLLLTVTKEAGTDD